MFVQLAQLMTIFHVDSIVVHERFRNTFGDPHAIYDTGLIGLRELVERSLELCHIETLVVERQASEDDSDVRMTPFRRGRGNTFRLFQVSA
jgi:hypothetical protein